VRLNWEPNASRRETGLLPRKQEPESRGYVWFDRNFVAQSL
jgi:hypothetical protein